MAELLGSNKLCDGIVDQICRDLLRGEDISQFKCQNYVTMEELVFAILYNWRQKNPSATIPELAIVLERCGLTQEAYKLDPDCKFIDNSWMIYIDT